MNHTTEWTPPHTHEPNPLPPHTDPQVIIEWTGRTKQLTQEVLSQLPQQDVGGCYIVSTGHGTSGPFIFGGVSLRDLLNQQGVENWVFVDVISADGFQTRISRDELEAETDRPILLALSLDGRPLRRQEGFVRLIVPDEEADALRQIKWVSHIRVVE